MLTIPNGFIKLLDAVSGTFHRWYIDRYSILVWQWQNIVVYIPCIVYSNCDIDFSTKDTQMNIGYVVTPLPKSWILLKLSQVAILWSPKHLWSYCEVRFIQCFFFFSFIQCFSWWPGNYRYECWYFIFLWTLYDNWRCWTPSILELHFFGYSCFT